MTMLASESLLHENKKNPVKNVLGSVPTGGNILYWIFSFHVVKPVMPILALLPMLCVCENSDCSPTFLKSH